MGHLVVCQSHLDEGGKIRVILDRGTTQQLHAGVSHRDETQQTVPGGEVRLLLVLLHLPDRPRGHKINTIHQSVLKVMSADKN